MKSIQSFLSTKGRLSRWPYFTYCLMLLILALVVGTLSDAFLVTLIILALYVCFLIQTIKRLHDLGVSGWWILLILVPVINLFAGIWVLFEKSYHKNESAV